MRSALGGGGGEGGHFSALGDIMICVGGHHECIKGGGGIWCIWGISSLHFEMSVLSWNTSSALTISPLTNDDILVLL